MDREVDRRDITLCSQLGIGEFGPIYDAEVQLRVNVTSRAVVKVIFPCSIVDSLHILKHTYKAV